MMNASLRRELVVAGIVIGGGFLLFAMLLAWLSSDLNRQAEKIQGARAAIATSIRSFERLADLQRGASGAARSAEALGALLPNKDELFEFPRTLDTLARINNVNLTFSFQGATVPPGPGVPGRTGFSITARGSAAAVAAFLAEIEARSQQFLLSLDALTLDRDGTEYRASGRGQVFFR